MVHYINFMVRLYRNSLTLEVFEWPHFWIPVWEEANGIYHGILIIFLESVGFWVGFWDDYSFFSSTMFSCLNIWLAYRLAFFVATVFFEEYLCFFRFLFYEIWAIMFTASFHSWAKFSFPNGFPNLQKKKNYSGDNIGQAWCTVVLVYTALLFFYSTGPLLLWSILQFFFSDGLTGVFAGKFPILGIWQENFEILEET